MVRTFAGYVARRYGSTAHRISLVSSGASDMLSDDPRVEQRVQDAALGISVNHLEGMVADLVKDVRTFTRTYS